MLKERQLCFTSSYTERNGNQLVNQQPESIWSGSSPVPLRQPLSPICPASRSWQCYGPEIWAGHISQNNRKPCFCVSTPHNTNSFKITTDWLVKMIIWLFKCVLSLSTSAYGLNYLPSTKSVLFFQEKPFSLIWQLSCSCECSLGILM